MPRKTLTFEIAESFKLPDGKHRYIVEWLMPDGRRMRPTYDFDSGVSFKQACEEMRAQLDDDPMVKIALGRKPRKPRQVKEHVGKKL